MKPILSIQEKDFSELRDEGRRAFIKFSAEVLSFYDGDIAFNVPAICLPANLNYINTCFELVDPLSNHYEFSQRHFDLLGLAASHLKRLYQEKIEALSTDAESEMRREICNSMARAYSVNADKWHGVPQSEGDAYNAKILRLREEAIEKFHLLETRYQAANETQESFERESSSPALFKEDEARPLLRRRLAPERPTSSPSPT